MLIQKRKKLSSLLPAAPCSDEMRDMLENIASKEGVSMAHLQRIAIQNFLDEITSKTNKNNSNYNKLEMDAS